MGWGRSGGGAYGGKAIVECAAKQPGHGVLTRSCAVALLSASSCEAPAQSASERSSSLPPSPAPTPAGGLILKAVMNAALPNFLELLAADYRHWAAGGVRDTNAVVGDLFAEPQAAQKQ